jgi:YggT family protein
MFLLKDLLIAVAQGIDIFLSFLYWLILIRALISWVSPDPYNPIVQFLYKTTDPLLDRIRRILPPLPVDLSPIIAFFIIYLLKNFIISVILDLAYSLK